MLAAEQENGNCEVGGKSQAGCAGSTWRKDGDAAEERKRFRPKRVCRWCCLHGQSAVDDGLHPGQSGERRNFRTLNLMERFTRSATGRSGHFPAGSAWCGCWESGEERDIGAIQVDNGPEFISQAVDQWAYAHGVALHSIEPGSRCRMLSSKVLREVPGRMPEPELVREPGRGAADHRSVAGGLQ